MTGTHRTVISPVVLAAASAVFGVIMLASGPIASAMPAMDMSGNSPAPSPAEHGEMPGMDMSGSTPTPTPTMDANMPGMDMPEAEHGSGDADSGHDSGDMPGMDMPEAEHGHGDTAEAPVHRPLVPVLGTFGGGSAAVLLTAGMMRRRDRAADLAKKAARAAGRAQK